MFTGVVVAKITDIKPHLDAERLQLCEVDDGERKFTVVTAATNVAVDKRYPFAQVGSQLSDGQKMKGRKLRGVMSEGMLCGATELGLSDTGTDLMELPKDAPLGENVRAYLDLDDNVF